MHHAITVLPFVLIASGALAAEPRHQPATWQQASLFFYRNAHVKAWVVEAERISADGMRQVAKTVAADMFKKNLGPQEMRIDDDGGRGSFLVTSGDKKRFTRAILTALPGRPVRILIVTGSWPARLDAPLANQLDQEASAIRYSHAFDGGVQSISYEWSPYR